MAPTSNTERERLQKVLEALQRLYAARDATTFPREMMAVANMLVPCVNVSFDTVDLATGEATDIFDRPISIPHEEFLKRWQVYCHQHPGIAYLENGGEASVMAITDFISQREFRRTAIYNEIFKPCGGGYQLGIILPVPGFVVGMAINRDKDFSAEEREFIEMLYPHFVQAFQNAQLLTALCGQAPTDFRPWRDRGLTRRECEVLQWIMEGKRNGEIAVILGGSPRTIGKHVEKILAKLQVESRAAAAAEARRLLNGGFIHPITSAPER
jgi:DNA-binding CsgD family transcriptional regulator